MPISSPRFPMRDPDLTHQVVLERSAHKGATQDITVTCNCLKRAGRKPMGLAPRYTETRALYNNPSNHAEPFNPEVDGLLPWEVRAYGERSESL